jgi:hypothetical protein
MKYKVISEDEKSFQIQHPDGSHFVVAKKGLGQETLEKIKSMKPQDEPVKLWDGGEVPDTLQYKDREVPDTLQYKDPSLFGGFQPQMIPDLTSQIKTAQAVESQMRPQLASAAPPSRPSLSVGSDGTLQVHTADMPLVNPQFPQQAPGSNLKTLQDASGMGLYNQAMGAMGMQAKGIQGMADAQSQGAKQQAQVYEAHNKALADFQQKADADRSALNKDLDTQMKSAMDAKVDPFRLWSNAGVGNKIAASIGLVLGGIGSGLTGQPNAGAQMLNNLMEKDVESQRANIGKQQNLLSMNYQKLKDMDQAEQLTMMQMNAQLQGKLAQTAANTQSDVAKSQATAMIGQLKQQQIPMQQSLMQSMMMRQLLAGGAQNMNPDFLPQDLRERAVRVPGRDGQSRLAFAFDKDTAHKFREAEKETDTLESKIKDAINFVDQKGWSPNPFGDDAGNAEVIRKSILSSMGQLHDLNRLTDTELHDIFMPMVPNPGQMNQSQAKTKLEGLMKLIQEKRNSAYKNELTGYDPGSIPQNSPIRPYNGK